jgi:hypothetical protein
MIEIHFDGLAKKHSFYVLTQPEAGDWDVWGPERLTLPNGLVVVTGAMTRDKLFDLAQVESWCRFDWAVPWEWQMDRLSRKEDVSAVWAYPHSGGLFGFPVFDCDVKRWVVGMFLVATENVGTVLLS